MKLFKNVNCLIGINRVRISSNSLLQPFWKSGLLIGPEVKVEVKRSKYSFGRSQVGGSKYRKGRSAAYPINRLAEHPTIDKFVPMCGRNFTFNDKIYINTTILSPCKAGCTGVQKGNNSMDRNYEGIF